MRFFCLLFLVFTWPGFIASVYSQDSIRVDFSVRVENLPIGEGGVHIAGGFAGAGAFTIQADWDPAAAGSQLVEVEPGLFQCTVFFSKNAANTDFEFQFVRDSQWSNDNGDVSEGNPGDCCLDQGCGVGGDGYYNRRIRLPTCAGRYTCIWNQCGTLQNLEGPGLVLSERLVLYCEGLPLTLQAETNGQLVWESSLELSCTTCASPTLLPQGPGTIRVSSRLNYCRVRDSLVLVPLNLKLQSLDTLVCPGKEVALSAVSNGPIAWEPASFLSCGQCLPPLALPLVSTWFVATARGANCSIRDSFRVDLRPGPTIGFTADSTILCRGESRLIVGSTNGSWTWLGDTIACSDCLFRRVIPARSSWFPARATLSGCSRTDSVWVEVHRLELEGPPKICRGDSLRLRSRSNGSIIWNLVPEMGFACSECPEITFPVQESKVFKAIGLVGQCLLSDSIRVEVDTIIVRLGQDVTISIGESTRLTAFGAPGYRWFPENELSCTSCSSPVATPSVSTKYYAESIVPGCKTLDSVWVWVKEDCSNLQVPNFFSPDANGKNDVFTMTSLLGTNGCRPDFLGIEIFNRWGKNVFTSNDPGFRFPDREVMPGVYFYQLRLRQIHLQGWFLLADRK
jgi:hypothetical protein